MSEGTDRKLSADYAYQRKQQINAEMRKLRAFLDAPLPEDGSLWRAKADVMTRLQKLRHEWDAMDFVIIMWEADDGC